MLNSNWYDLYVTEYYKCKKCGKIESTVRDNLCDGCSGRASLKLVLSKLKKDTEVQDTLNRTNYEHDKMMDRVIPPYVANQPWELLLNASLGLAGEGGEVADETKKVKYHGHPMDKDKYINELGDIVFYVKMACRALNITMEEVMKKNIEKLNKRYPNGFSTQDSLDRKDTKGPGYGVPANTEKGV